MINLYYYAEDRFTTPKAVYDASVARFNQPGGAITLIADEIETIPNKLNAASGSVLYTCHGEVVIASEKMRALLTRAGMSESVPIA